MRKGNCEKGYSIRAYSFNVRTHLFNFGVWDITLTNMAEEVESDDSGIKAFFEHVLNRTEEILSQSSTASNERHAEVLTHVDLLERTVRLTG